VTRLATLTISLLGAALLASSTLAGRENHAASTPARVALAATLPDLPLADVANAAVPGSVADDHGLLLGGVGSDLWHGPGDGADEFWMVTDRGPNGQVTVDGKTRHTVPVPGFTPLILRVAATADGLVPRQVIPIVGQSGAEVTGLPNLAGRDEPPYDATGESRWGFYPSGLDTEGLVRTSAGDFWLADEYGPSLVHVNAAGMVLKRFVPHGLGLSGTDYPVQGALPAIYAARKSNRGFEGLALSPDERTLYAVLQSPLSNPDERTGERSRTTRILAFDLATESTAAEYLYRLEPAEELEPDARPSDLKLSAVTAIGPRALLVLERTDTAARVYRVDLPDPPGVLGGAADDAETTPSVESLDDPVEQGYAVLSKALVLDLAQVTGVPQKIEGLALVDADTLAIANDNDFDLGAFDATGRNVGAGVKSQLLLLDLVAPLSSEP